MSDDEVTILIVLLMTLIVVVAPAALIVWLVLCALRRSRARDAEHPSPRGFDIVEAKRTV